MQTHLYAHGTKYFDQYCMQELIDEKYHWFQLFCFDLKLAIEPVHLKNEHKVHSKLTAFDYYLFELSNGR